MNKKKQTRPSYTFQPRAAHNFSRFTMIVAATLGIGVRSATAQIYETDSTVLGKTTSETGEIQWINRAF